MRGGFIEEDAQQHTVVASLGYNEMHLFKRSASSEEHFLATLSYYVVGASFLVHMY